MKTIEEIDKIIKDEMAVMVYFSAPTCNVCHALKPKLFDAIKNEFEKFVIVDVDISISQDIAAHFNVFSIPTVLIFLDSREFFRKSRNMSISEVIREIKRPYEMMLS
jgi:thioredoxin-like negative regulator of GroEL